MDWQPFEMAPKDGSVIIGYAPTGTSSGGGGLIYALLAWSQMHGGWDIGPRQQMMTDGKSVTHWFPLPKPPK